MKIGMLFPGYGSQFVGMAKDLYDDSRTVQEYFEEASSCLDINFIKLCFASSDAEISQPMHAYLSLFLVQSALSALLTKAGIAPTLVAGYGIGQFAAIHSAKGFTFPDGLYVLKKYAQFYEETLETLNGAVIKVTGMTQEDLEKSLALVKATKTLAIAAYNTPTEFIVSGEAEDVETLRELLSKKKKVKVKSVDQAFGLHSNLMDSVVEQLSLYLGKVDFKELNTPLSNNVNAEISAQPEDTKKAVISQIF